MAMIAPGPRVLILELRLSGELRSRRPVVVVPNRDPTTTLDELDGVLASQLEGLSEGLLLPADLGRGELSLPRLSLMSGSGAGDS